MPRLGELLIASGSLTTEQLEQALRAQVMWGGRLGTNLIELGYIDLDSLTQVLAEQHKIPGALARHFEKADAMLQAQLPSELAERHLCVPLMHVAARGDHEARVIVVAMDALDKPSRIELAKTLGVALRQLVVSIAPELRVRYQLERVYGIQRNSRFLRSRGKTIPPFPQLDVDALKFEDSEVDIPLPAETPAPAPAPAPEPAKKPPALIVEEDPAPARAASEGEGYESVSLELPAEDELAIPTEPTADEEESGRNRRRYVRSITEEPSTDSERQALARIPIRKVAVGGPGAATIADATRQIRRSTDRDRVADLLVAALDRFVPTCDAAIVLVVRGELAIGWKGFSRTVNALPEIGVPLEVAGLVPRVIEKNVTLRAPASDLSDVDKLLMRSLGCKQGELLCVPITIGTQVMCVIALAGSKDTSAVNAEALAAAAASGFARLMRHAAR